MPTFDLKMKFLNVDCIFLQLQKHILCHCALFLVRKRFGIRSNCMPNLNFSASVVSEIGDLYMATQKVLGIIFVSISYSRDVSFYIHNGKLIYAYLLFLRVMWSLKSNLTMITIWKQSYFCTKKIVLGW